MNKLFRFKYSIFISVLVVFVVSLLLLLFKYSYSIYADQVKRDNNNFSSSSVYISSDLISNYGYNGIVNFYSYDTNNYEFKVFNYESDSQISTKDINYNIFCSVSNRYLCDIDGNGNSNDYTLSKSYSCSVAGLTEEQCKNTSGATLTYNKVENTHTISVKSASGGVATGSTDVYLIMTTSKPFVKTFTVRLKVHFNGDEQEIKIVPIATSDYQCRYEITNYSDEYREYVFRTYDDTVLFNKLNNTTGRTYSTYLERYKKYYLEVYKKDIYLSCDNAISLQS